MARSVAFLRGINLGRRRVTSVQLCAPFEALGLRDVRAYQASGNVVFDHDDEVAAPALASAIEAAVVAALGFESRTFLRTAAEVAAMVARRPFPPAVFAATEGREQVVLLAAPPPPAARDAVLALATPDDHLAVEGAEVHWLPTVGVSTSDLDLAALERLVGPTTTRTAGTLARIHARFLATDG